MTKKIFSYSNKKFVITILLLIGLEQVLSASITAFLGLAGKNIMNPDRFITYLALVLIFSLLPNVLHIFIRKIEMQGYLDMYFEYLRERLISKSAQPEIWKNSHQKERYMSAIGPEAEGALLSATYNYFDNYKYLLNILLNSIAISLVIDLKFAVVFGVSAACAFFVYQARKSSLDKLVSEEQATRLNFSSYVLRAWDNVFLKNKDVFVRYQEKLNSHYGLTRKLTGAVGFKAYSLVLLLTLITSVPVFALTLFLAWTQRTEAAMLAALVVTLPRQMQVLAVLNAFFQQITNLKIFTAKVQSCLENSNLESIDLGSCVDYSKIKINGASVESLSDVLRKIEEASLGRILISGANGAGKSSLILELSKHLKNSFYIPAASNFEIGVNLDQMSTGQKVLKQLEFAIEETNGPLLLDEWNANLDPFNRMQVGEMLEKLSLQRQVIEIRHA